MRDQRSAMRPALLISLVVHLAFVAVARLPHSPPASEPAAPSPGDTVDIWAGETASLPGSGARIGPIDTDERGVAEALAAPTPAEANALTPVVAPPPPAKRRDEERASRSSPQGLDEKVARRPRRARTAAKAPPSRGAGADPGRTTMNGGGEGAEGPFGAAGGSAVRSLGRAFTRAIPPACQADPAWSTLPAGRTGATRFVIEIDAAGHIASWEAEGDEPPRPPLLNLMKRTIALLGAGTFAVTRGAVTAGRQTLEVSAVVSDGSPEGEDAATAELSWRFEDGRGKASFTQAGGRHVDVSVRVLHAEVDAAGPPG